MVEDSSMIPLQDPSVKTPTMLSLQKSLEEGKTVIGIDIGVGSVNVAQTAFYNSRPTLIKTVVEKIALANERERDKATREALNQALSKFNIKNAHIICVMPGQFTVLETLAMPVMPRHELADAVKLEVNSSQSFLIDNPVIDFQVVGRIADKGVQKKKVLVAAAPNTAVDDLLANFIPLQTKPLNGSDRSLSKHSRVKVDAIVPLAIAFENIIKQSKLRMDETIAVIDMGKSLTDLNIYHSCQLELSRKVSVAGIDLTRSLMSALFTSAGKIELTMEKAESIKREFGIPAPGESYLIQGKITAAQVLSLLRPKLEQLASEISRSFDYYREKIGGGKVDRIILFGGGAQLKGLPEYLNAELGLPVELGNPLHDVDPLCDEVIPNKEDALRLVRAIGASLGEASEINLLPESIREWKSRSVEQMAVIVGMSVFLGILCLSYFGSMARMALMREREAAAKRGYEAVVPQLEKLKNGLLLKRMIRNRADVAGLIRQLSYLPEDVYLTELTLSSGKIYVSGFVSGVDKKAKDSSAQLVAALRRGIMPDAKLLSDTKNVPGKAAKLFEVEGHLGAEGDSK